jgi:hypothetical protein
MHAPVDMHGTDEDDETAKTAGRTRGIATAASKRAELKKTT